MKKFYVKNISTSAKIEGEEFEHLNKVLRCKVGEIIKCLSADGNEYILRIEKIENDFAEIKVLEVKKCDGDPKISITVFMGLPKKEKFEFLIQKLSELGVSNLIPFESSYTIAKPKEKKQDRYNKIAIEACKQCGRTKPLKIEECINFKTLLSKISEYQKCYFAYENSKNGNFDDVVGCNKVAIIVGAEGGFSNDEAQKLLDAGVKAVTLGNRILRCETAPLFSVSIINYLTNN